jgi:peptide/nickel transport system permease protein
MMQRGTLVDLWRALRSSRLALIGLILLGGFLLVALFAPAIAPHDPKTLFKPLLPPSAQHLLGTDDIGHDLFSELCYGARFSLSISLLSALLSTALGTVLGLLAGYDVRSGYLIMRAVDVFLAVPRFPLVVLMAAFLRPGARTLLLFFTLFGWPRAARLVRAQVLSERNKGYVEAAQLIGARDSRIVFRHLLPGTVPIALPRFIAEFQHVIVAESGLSFLGLGNPLVKSWGLILSFAFRYPTIYITDLWVRWALPPGLCITLVVLALALVSFALETWANPRLRAQHERRTTQETSPLAST